MGSATGEFGDGSNQTTSKNWKRVEEGQRTTIYIYSTKGVRFSVVSYPFFLGDSYLMFLSIMHVQQHPLYGLLANM